MTKLSAISKQDSELFRKAVKGIKPLEQDPFIVNRPKPKVGFIRKNMADSGNHIVVAEMNENAALAPGDMLSYRNHGFRKQAWRKLQGGKLTVEETLDLHGMTVNAAEKAFADFLTTCRDRNRCCIRIIHGKGLGSESNHPVIKNKINVWLRQRKNVLAFCSATPADGGTGAVYVVLKKTKRHTDN